MCGIAGHLSFSLPPQRSLIDSMVQSIRHRGPDTQGLWQSSCNACVLGHARLSIIDLSSLGHQPMIDPETGNCIVFNGEIYNFQSLRKECEAAGHRFFSKTDTEVILVLYRRHGVECLRYLRGMFAFSIWDEQQQRLFFARDRVGKKPLNYSVLENGLVFCSEIDPISRHPSVSRTMDLEALELYLQCQYIPAPWTIYQSIRKLPPAHYGIYDRKGLRLVQYWNVHYKTKVRISEQDALDGLDEKLTEAVRHRMIADVPLGALLSGGVDSSLVVALMAKLNGNPIRTYSIGFREDAFNELPYAAQVAETCKTIHHPEIVEGNVEHLLPLLARHYGEPYADASAVPSFLVSQAAKKHVTVVMNGDGGDELLGGYSRYWLSTAKLWMARQTPDLMSAKQLVALAARLSNVTSIPERVVRKLVTEYGWPELRSVNMYSGFWDDSIRAKLLGPLSNPGLLFGWRTDWLKKAMKNADNSVDRMLWYDNHTYLPGDLLFKMDIASMHCGLETRSPLLDHEVIEFCSSLPLVYKVKNGIGKYLLKRLAVQHFPADFVHRRKMGFGIPLARWLRGPLRPVLEQTLLNKELMQPLNSTVIKTTLDTFFRGDDQQESRLWALLMYGNWRKHAGGGALW